jgi:hypothetical protein
MGRGSIAQKLTQAPDQGSSSLQLNDGSNVAIVGGGPAGSYFAYFLLSMADMIDLDLQVDVYEPRNFLTPGPKSCMPPGWQMKEFDCQCSPRVNINGAVQPFGDRIAFIGAVQRTFLTRIQADPSLAFRIVRAMSSRIHQLIDELIMLKGRG